MKLVISLLISLIAYQVSFSQSPETFKLNWKKMKGWKQASHQEQNGTYLTEYLKKGESFEDWSELIAIQKIPAPGASKIPLEHLMNSGFEQFKKNAPEATLTVIEKSENIKFPWIEYKSEAPRFNNNPNPESQFFHVVTTEHSIFLIWWATKEAQIESESLALYQEFFQSGKIE